MRVVGSDPKHHTGNLGMPAQSVQGVLEDSPAAKGKVLLGHGRLHATAATRRRDDGPNARVIVHLPTRGGRPPDLDLYADAAADAVDGGFGGDALHRGHLARQIGAGGFQ